ncbi:MAG: hypothetical protein U9Q83_04935 [Bacteroidota bacterium]|nr:hypothetical protein [Bacteroidota bacterium]
MAFNIKEYLQNLKYMHFSEFWWLVTHPFIAKKTLDISKHARNIADEYIADTELDGDNNGGMVDAFRHCLWMAMLVQEIKPKAAKKLGNAHEKGNYKDFKKKILEEDSLPDYKSCEMDLKNNSVGLELGKEFLGSDLETLIQLVKKKVTSGVCWKIRKNSMGRFLDENANIIPPKDWIGKWITPKILVPSDF